MMSVMRWEDSGWPAENKSEPTGSRVETRLLQARVDLASPVVLFFTGRDQERFALWLRSRVRAGRPIPHFAAARRCEIRPAGYGNTKPHCASPQRECHLTNIVARGDLFL
ncbi:MAG TPA: hypothetical protein VGM07_22125 [Stellaceae bacterium]|jgi:hypothetical protein